jgi:hypothetical protein
MAAPGSHSSCSSSTLNTGRRRMCKRTLAAYRLLWSRPAAGSIRRRRLRREHDSGVAAGRHRSPRWRGLRARVASSRRGGMGARGRVLAVTASNGRCSHITLRWRRWCAAGSGGARGAQQWGSRLPQRLRGVRQRASAARLRGAGDCEGAAQGLKRGRLRGGRCVRRSACRHGRCQRPPHDACGALDARGVCCMRAPLVCNAVGTRALVRASSRTVAQRARPQRSNHLRLGYRGGRTARRAHCRGCGSCGLRPAAPARAAWSRQAGQRQRESAVASRRCRLPSTWYRRRLLCRQRGTALMHCLHRQACQLTARRAGCRDHMCSSARVGNAPAEKQAPPRPAACPA